MVLGSFTRKVGGGPLIYSEFSRIFTFFTPGGSSDPIIGKWVKVLLPAFILLFYLSTDQPTGKFINIFYRSMYGIISLKKNTFLIIYHYV